MANQGPDFNSCLSPWAAAHVTLVQSHEWTTSAPLSVSIIQTVAAVTDSQLDELQPLADVIDPETLDHLFQSPSGRSTLPCTVSFIYEGRPITVTHEGEIQVYAPAAATDCL